MALRRAPQYGFLMGENIGRSRKKGLTELLHLCFIMAANPDSGPSDSLTSWLKQGLGADSQR